MTPTPVELAGFLGCLFFVVAGINSLLTLKAKLTGDKKEISPQPLTVKAVGEFATEQDCRQRAEKVEAGLAELRRVRDQDLKDASTSRSAIYNKIEKSAEGTHNHIEGVRQELNQKIDDVPDRVIATLRNFGVIGK